MHWLVHWGLTVKAYSPSSYVQWAWHLKRSIFSILSLFQVGLKQGTQLRSMNRKTKPKFVNLWSPGMMAELYDQSVRSAEDSRDVQSSRLLFHSQRHFPHVSSYHWRAPNSRRRHFYSVFSRSNRSDALLHAALEAWKLRSNHPIISDWVASLLTSCSEESHWLTNITLD